MTETVVQTSEKTPGMVLPRRPFLFVMALSMLVAFAFQGSRGLYESTEGRYAECARQSMEQGRLDEPVLNGKEHWTKPPLTYYCIAGGMAVLGKNTWGARIGLSIAFVITVLAMYQLGGLVWGPRGAFFCAVAYAFGLFPPAAAAVLTTDTYLAMWETLTLMAFWLAVRRGRWAYMALMWVFFGFAFMTKGFPAALCLIAPFVTFVYLRRKGEKVTQFFNPLGLVLFVIIGFSWYLQKGLTHPGLLHYWVFEEGIARNVGGEFNRNSQFYKPVTIYGPVLLAGLLPWGLFILWRRKHIPWPTGMWKRVTSWSNPVEWLFIVTGFLVPLVLLCLSSSRMPMYALPLFTVIALALGKGIEHLVSGGHLKLRTVMITSIVVAMLLVFVKGGAEYLGDSASNMKVLAKDLKPILDKFPKHELHVLKHPPFYGLQFYLNDIRVDKVELEDSQGVVVRAKSGTPQLTLVRTRTLKKFEEQMDRRVYQEYPVNDNWALIAIMPPDQPAPTP